MQSMDSRIRLPVVMTAGVCIPAAPGTYALLLYVHEPATLKVGKLGLFQLPQQEYIYFGSALGPGGLRGRISRHMRHEKRPHWHIDALTQHAEVCAVWYTASSSHLECQWCQAVSTIDQAWVPVPGFGASDCASACDAHLIAFTQPPTLDALTAMLTTASAGKPVLVQR